MVVERFEFDLDVGGLHNLVDFAVLLATDELPMFIGELDLEANFMVERLANQLNREKCSTMIANLYDVQFHDHVYCSPYFMFETVHFETHALENNLGACRVRNLLQQLGHLRWSKRSRWK